MTQLTAQPAQTPPATAPPSPQMPTAPKTRRSASRVARPRSHRVIIGALLAYLGLPLLALLVFSFARSWGATILPTGYTLDHWIAVFTSSDVAAATGRSLFVTTMVCLINILIVVPAAYVAIVVAPRVRPLIHALAIVPFALPWIVVAAGVQLTVGEFAPHLFATVGLLVFTITAVTFPYLYWAVENALITNNVQQLAEAAQMSGAGVLQTLVRVVVPAARTGIMSGSLMVAAAAFGEFAITLTLIGGSYETLPLWSLRMFSGRTPGAGGELAAVSFGIFVLLFLLSLLLSRIDSGSTHTLTGTASVGRKRKGDKR